MKCPHCLVEYHDQPNEITLGPADVEFFWISRVRHCPACKKLNIELEGRRKVTGGRGAGAVKQCFLAYPKGALRPPPPIEVPQDLAGDYTEACLVLPDSPKASAALSRRCLQHLLPDYAHVPKGTLDAEIPHALENRLVPSYLADSLDDIRAIGNFAAHPTKSKSTGEILDVEPGEADANLDLLEGLFDSFFVQPAKTMQRKAALDKKLADAGKPPSKSVVP